MDPTGDPRARVRHDDQGGGHRTTTEGPVLSGDTIHVECEVIEARRSNSRPGRGLVRTHNRVIKQDGKVALTYTPLRMVKCRDAAH